MRLIVLVGAVSTKNITGGDGDDDDEDVHMMVEGTELRTGKVEHTGHPSQVHPSPQLQLPEEPHPQPPILIYLVWGGGVKGLEGFVVCGWGC